MFLKVVGFLVMLPSILWAILTFRTVGYIWFAIGACIYYLGHRQSERSAAERERYSCPHCGEQVLKIAKICPHCRSPLTPTN